MKTGVATWELSPVRLLPLLLVTLLSIIGVNAVHGPTGKSLNIPKYILSKQTLGLGDPYPGQYQLFNRCSNKFVQIREGGRRRKKGGRRKGRIDARGKVGNMDTQLLFESHADGTVYIRSLHRKKYICFNKKGKLILRHTETTLCLFVQVPTFDNYTELKSVVNPRWYIGFSKKGHRLKGYARRLPRKRSCFKFIVRGIEKRKRRKWSPIKSGASLSDLLRRQKLS